MYRNIVPIGMAILVALGAADFSAAQMRGSIIEDRAARKLLEAGDARLDANESEKALEIWKSVIERYPRSKVRFDAHIRLGDFMLNKNNAYDQARAHFEAAAGEDNPDEDKRAEATLKTGICSFEARLYSKCFKIMRQVIEEFPASDYVNQAYYYVGLGHFKLGHYSRAIDALEKVGTAFSSEDKDVEKVEAGKRLFVKIDDTDLAILEEGETVKITCRTTNDDEETVECIPLGRNIRVVLGSIPTALGKAKPGNGILEVRGGDKVNVTYTDQHTADQKFNQPRLKEIQVVGNAIAQITDGAFLETLNGVVLGKTVNLQITDADFDVSDDADSLKAMVEIYRAKTQEEMDEELAALVAGGEVSDSDDEEAPKVDPLKKVAGKEVILTEMEPVKEDADEETVAGSPDGAPVAPADPAEADPLGSDFLAEIEADVLVDNSIHTGVFRTSIPLARDGVDTYSSGIKALPSDILRVTFVDALNISSDSQTVKAEARCIEGNLGGVR
ncbi:MAG: tetratricopeptide repeat protein, partial [Verrucomicrobiota bacterium]